MRRRSGPQTVRRLTCFLAQGRRLKLDAILSDNHGGCPHPCLHTAAAAPATRGLCRCRCLSCCRRPSLSHCLSLASLLPLPFLRLPSGCRRLGGEGAAWAATLLFQHVCCWAPGDAGQACGLPQAGADGLAPLLHPGSCTAHSRQHRREYQYISLPALLTSGTGCVKHSTADWTGDHCASHRPRQPSS